MKEYDKNIKFYTGIGSRETPSHILSVMTKIALYLSCNKYVLRSGGASGADSAFEKGAENNKQIFIPWKNFNNNSSVYFNISEEAMNMAEKFHPNFSSLKAPVKKLHARNCYQILGENLKNPSKFVICWTKDGKEVGGTSQALRVARYNNIKIYNLANKKDLDFWKFLI